MVHKDSAKSVLLGIQPLKAFGCFPCNQAFVREYGPLAFRAFAFEQHIHSPIQIAGRLVICALSAEFHSGL